MRPDSETSAKALLRSTVDQVVTYLQAFVVESTISTAVLNITNLLKLSTSSPKKHKHKKSTHKSKKKHRETDKPVPVTDEPKETEEEAMKNLTDNVTEIATVAPAQLINQEHLMNKLSALIAKYECAALASAAAMSGLSVTLRGALSAIEEVLQTPTSDNSIIDRKNSVNNYSHANGTGSFSRSGGGDKEDELTSLSSLAPGGQLKAGEAERVKAQRQSRLDRLSVLNQRDKQNVIHADASEEKGRKSHSAIKATLPTATIDHAPITESARGFITIAPLSYSAVAALLAVGDIAIGIKEESFPLEDVTSIPIVSAFDDPARCGDDDDGTDQNMLDLPIDSSRQDARVFFSSLGLLENYFSTCEYTMHGQSISPQHSSKRIPTCSDTATDLIQEKIPDKKPDSKRAVPVGEGVEVPVGVGEGMEMVLSWRKWKSVACGLQDALEADRALLYSWR